MPMKTAILLAAGSGSRMQGTVADKSLAMLAGTPALVYCLQAFQASACIDRVIIVYRDAEQLRQLQEAFKSATGLSDLHTDWVPGGKERQVSVLNGLEAAEGSDFVFIHDCARPLIRPQSIKALHDVVIREGAAVLAHPVTDTIKRIAKAGALTQTHLEDLDRERLWAMETPQAFSYSTIRDAYTHIALKGLRITDDTAAAATIGVLTTIVPNETANPKITTPADLDYAEYLLGLPDK